MVNSFDEADKLVCVGDLNGSVGRKFPQGFRWLDHWELIVPFRPYSELLIDQVTDMEDDNIKKLGDLRVPTYDTRMVFLVTNQKMKQFWKLYNGLVGSGYHDSVAFYIALWEKKPYYKPLPAKEWVH